MNAADTHASWHTLTLRGPRVVFGPKVAPTDLAAELNLLPARRALLLASPREHKARADVLDPIRDWVVGHVEDIHFIHHCG